MVFGVGEQELLHVFGVLADGDVDQLGDVVRDFTAFGVK